VTPLVARLLWGYGVRGERVTATQLGGAGLLLAGVALASGRWTKKASPA
jgi:drug/metabolite transporter (DMT)-like permease